VRARAALTTTTPLVCARQRPLQFPLRPYKMGLLHYAQFRPHQGLGGATPAEMYFGRTPSHLSAIPPPRGRPGEGPTDLPFRIEYLDAERLLPVLVRKAA
jgi:hypothetical protein